jgi:ABC-type multidrug transport system ATPase subunit
MENPDILILDEPMNGLDNQVYEMDHGKLAVSE